MQSPGIDIGVILVPNFIKISEIIAEISFNNFLNGSVHYLEFFFNLTF